MRTILAAIILLVRRQLRLQAMTTWNATRSLLPICESTATPHNAPNHCIVAAEPPITRSLAGPLRTGTEASALAHASPHQIMTQGTKAWAASLGFRWQTIPYGAGNSCVERFCLIWP
jgi:hypothetical protein